MFTAGALNRRVKIQTQTATQDDAGQPLTTWTDVLNTWASIHAVTGKEVYAASGFVTELSHVVTIRYPSVAVNSTMRVVYKDRTFLIQAVTNPNEADIQLDLLCKENR